MSKPKHLFQLILNYCMTHTHSTQQFAPSIALAFFLASIISFSIATFAFADTLYRQLELGNRGTDVSSLQTFLAQDVTLYPQGTVSGYFGYLTKSSVARFQVRNGLPAVGRVGPATLPIINAQMNGGMVSTDGAAMIGSISISPAKNNATVSWNTSESATGTVYYSTSPLVTNELDNAVTVSGSTAYTDTNIHTSQSVYLSNLQANTVYYYLIYTTDQNGNVSVTWPKTFQTTN
jgi:peptidoglycan hydrolase-like protein with peptidoglycan-binding domain